MTATATSQDATLGLSYTDYTTNAALQSIITNVIDAIIEQDSTDRGAWDVVVVKRIALTSCYSECTVRREINRMLRSDALYENCLEIRDGVFFMTYLRNSSELLSSATSETEEEADR